MRFNNWEIRFFIDYYWILYSYACVKKFFDLDLPTNYEGGGGALFRWVSGGNCVGYSG